ncbi:uncharacterized protein LOC144054063 isoform X4 [Vanacampus margaritifer]
MMGSFQRSRPRFMSSPVLSDLTRFHAGPNTLHACNSTIWNSSLTGSGCRVASCHTHSQRPISSDQSLQGRSSAVQRALHVEREHQVAAKERDGLLRHRLLAESSADGRPDGDSGAHLRLRWRAAGGAGRGLVALLHRNAAYPSGHLLPAAGSGAVRPPDGAVGLPRFGAAEAPPGGRSANCGRRATRRHAHAAGAAESRSGGLPWLLGDGSQPDMCWSLAPLAEHEGEAYLEKAGAMRRHTVANAHSDARLLTGGMRRVAETDDGAGDPAQPIAAARHFGSRPHVKDT